jgi:hypothetical protein
MLKAIHFEKQQLRVVPTKRIERFSGHPDMGDEVGLQLCHEAFTISKQVAGILGRPTSDRIRRDYLHGPASRKSHASRHSPTLLHAC